MVDLRKCGVCAPHIPSIRGNVECRLSNMLSHDAHDRAATASNWERCSADGAKHSSSRNLQFQVSSTPLPQCQIKIPTTVTGRDKFLHILRNFGLLSLGATHL